MHDPYLYENSSVLKNRMNIMDADLLREAEGEITKLTMPIVYRHDFKKFNTATMLEIHKIIFGDIFEWAGEIRTIPIIKAEPVLGGDTVRYSSPSEIKKKLDDIAKEITKLKKSEDKKNLLFKIVRITANLWQIHPFREGNTRSIISFSVLLAQHLDIELNYDLFEKYAAYVRNSLVWASQGRYSKFEYLENIFFDAAELFESDTSADQTKPKDYTTVNGYYVADYRETPHIYYDEDKNK